MCLNFFLRKKGDVEEKERGHADDNMKQKEVKKTDDTEQIGDEYDDDDDGDDDDKHKDAAVSEKDNGKDREKKDSVRNRLKPTLRR